MNMPSRVILVTPDVKTFEKRGRIRTLAKDVFFVWRNIVYKIEAGFKWNGASIPFWLWWWVSPWRWWVRVASCVHDYLYGKRMFTRRECDRIFLQLLLVSIRRSRWRWLRYRRTIQARIMYAAVREWGDNVAGVDW